MTLSAWFLLAIGLIAAILLIATRIRADLVALLTRSALALSGVVSPAEAFAGSSSSADIPVLSVILPSHETRPGGLHLISRL